jgi:monothiol glutaredoxin
MRPILEQTKLNSEAAKFVETFHREIISEVELAITQNEWVIVGMASNLFVSKARNYLAQKGLKFAYIQHGSYFSKWKERLAIKLWSGWPTFPQVFHKGRLIGGYEDLIKYLP